MEASPMVGDKPVLRVGLIGTGFMGKTHVFGFASAPRVFDLPYEIVLHAVADRSDELAGEAARALGFAHATGDWRALVQDPEIDLVDITTPNAFHKEMALAAIAAGKHVETLNFKEITHTSSVMVSSEEATRGRAVLQALR